MHNKQEIVNEYLLGGSSYRDLARKHGVSRTTINNWVMGYEGRGIARERVVERVTSPPMETEKNTLGLSLEVLELQKQLEQERLRNKLLTAMIDIAEEELKIPIRKKYGTRPLKK